MVSNRKMYLTTRINSWSKRSYADCDDRPQKRIRTIKYNSTLTSNGNNVEICSFNLKNKKIFWYND